MIDYYVHEDEDGDTLSIKWCSDGEPVLQASEGGVILNRDALLELQQQLAKYLVATDPHPHGPSPEALDAAGVSDSIALEAHDAVYGDRQADYGHPREDFTRAAIIWTGLLQHKLADGAYIEADDIGRCMIGTKLARDVHSPKRDNRVDIAGYAITLDRLETGR